MAIFSCDKSYGDIVPPRGAFRFGGKLNIDKANSQSTIDRDHAEVLVLAELRHRLTDLVHRPHPGEWDDYADDLEPLAALDYNPTHSVIAAGGAERTR